MTHEPIISVSGLRGTVGGSLTPDVAIRYACAFASQTGRGPIVVTRDGRSTGAMIADLIKGALTAVGRDVWDGGIAATPTTGVLVRQLQAAGGLQISASHNPAEYNGMKLFGPDGRVISEKAGQPVLREYQSKRSPEWVEHDHIGTASDCVDTLSHHAQLVLDTVDVQAIRSRRFNVLLDSNHGAGSLLGCMLLDSLGCRLSPIGLPPDGKFEHKPEPTAENLTGVCDRVRQQSVDVGFCQDPDADRLALIDSDGCYVGEEYTLAITVRHVLSKRRGPIVTNCSTSRMSEDIAKQLGVPCHHSKVGEANVTAMMIERDAVFGGEGNGGPIDPRVGYVRDSFVGMALVLDAMAETGHTLRQLADQLPRYQIFKTKVAMDRAQMSAGFDRLEQQFSDGAVSRLDGLRFDWPEGWLLIRASNTEPIVRLIAEASSLDSAQRWCDTAASVLNT